MVAYAWRTRCLRLATISFIYNLPLNIAYVREGNLHMDALSNILLYNANLSDVHLQATLQRDVSRSNFARKPTACAACHLGLLIREMLQAF